MTFNARKNNRIRSIARRNLLRAAVGSLKHSAIAHAAGIESGHFSQIWNGQRGIGNISWKRLLLALPPVQE